MVMTSSWTTTLGPSKGPQGEGYDINKEPLFGKYDHTTGRETVPNDDTDNEGELAMDEDGAEGNAHASDGKKR
jgi:hypothetical protein